MEHIVSLFLFLGLAVWEDYHVQKISNFLNFTALISAVLYQLGQKGALGIFEALFQAGVVILILFPLYVFHIFGAGDIKLLGVAAAFLSWQLTLQALLAGMYLSLIPIFVSFFGREKKLAKKISMSGPILGGILLVLCKEGCI